MKKKIVSVCLVVCLLATAIIGTTLAYFTDKTEVVTNTFTSGKVDITLDEAKTDEGGVPVEGNVRVDGTEGKEGNVYKLFPGKTYTKDPTVRIGANSEDCYVFVKVENGLSSLEVADGAGDTIAEQMTANGWIAVTGTAENPVPAGVYVYSTDGSEPAVVSYNAEADANNDLVVFENFTITESATADDLGAAKTASITITAYAIQAEGMSSKTAAELWTDGGWA